ncbi:MAG: aldehyde dehydrogenase family protein [Pirellulaceae bacterium]|nr:aldehyde dehydrogenase family protein [Pirellulaceae bacterium]
MATGLFIGGQWRPGADHIAVTNKFTHQVIGQVAVPSSADIELALASAVSGAAIMSALPTHQRYDILSRTAQLILARKVSLAQTIAQEAGKPIKFARVEVDRAAMTFQLAAEEARRIHGETLALDAIPSGEGFFGFWWRKPVGVVAAITPFNFPLNLVAHKLAPAIAAGNAFIHKPAEVTPLTAVALMEILLEAGLPPMAGQLLPGSGKVVGDAIVADPRVRKVTFTGSAEVGRLIISRAGIKKVTLELGNSSPVIVAEDADLEFAARRCAIGAFAHSGQVCISVQRIYVDQRIEDKFRDLLIAATQAIQVGDPLLDQTDVGPMIAEKEAERIEQWVSQAEQGGAVRLVGGQRDGAVYYPTLLDKTTADMQVTRNEVFAPVATFGTYANFDEALRAANSTDYGLQASLFTQNIDRVFKSIRQLDFGGVIVNDMPGFRADHMPYGGNKQSGLGREGLKFAIEEMTNIQTVAIRMPE